MNIVIFTNDTYFSYLLSKSLFEKYHSSISHVIFSDRTTGSIRMIYKVFQSTNYKYFSYRTLVQLITWWNKLFGRRTVSSLSKLFNIDRTSAKNISEISLALGKVEGADVGVALNFDQILPSYIINAFEYGVLNIHASKLPDYRGVSPALWAFAEGNSEIWTSIYLINEDIDMGEILAQFKVLVEQKDTAFSVYKRICEKSGACLVSVVEAYLRGCIEAKKIDRSKDGRYYSWPDREHALLMKRHCRRYIRISDIIKAIF